MNCQEIRELLDTCATGELAPQDARVVSDHLAGCEACRAFETRRRTLVSALRETGEAFEPAERFELAADAAPAVPPASGAPRLAVASKALWRWRVAATAAAALAIFAASALAVPAIARQLPLPVGNEIAELEARNSALEQRASQLSAENDALAQQVDELEIRIEEIGGEDVPVIDTTPGDLPAEVNNAVQMLAMEFIRAQYAGDLEALAALGTDRLKADLAEHPESYLREPGASVTFAQMTETAVTEDGVYLLFVRLLDSAEWSESQYQEDFEIIKIGDTYLVDFMGMDA